MIYLRSAVAMDLNSYSRKIVGAGALVLGATSFMAGRADAPEPMQPQVPTAKAANDPALPPHAAIEESLRRLEPQLRGKDVRVVIVSDDGKVQAVREMKFGEHAEHNKLLLWAGIAGCLLTTATLSGLTIGMFSVSKIRLSVLASNGDQDAQKILGLRNDSNMLLSTLLWGNMATNVVLTHLADTAITGLGGMAFSIGAITLLGEILPQSYFSKNALRVGAKLTPLMKGLSIALYPVAKPSGMLMDLIVGKGGLEHYTEKDLHSLLKLHAESAGQDISKVEAQGAVNFLAFDDIKVKDEGETLDGDSIITLPFENEKPVMPSPPLTADHELLKKIGCSEKKWVVICDLAGEPRLVLDADSFLRDILFDSQNLKPDHYWHKPILVRDSAVTMGQVLGKFSVQKESERDDVVDDDMILYWTDSEKRVITGADILGRLLRDIAQAQPVPREAERKVDSK